MATKFGTSSDILAHLSTGQTDSNFSVLELLEDPDQVHTDKEVTDLSDTTVVSLVPVNRFMSYLQQLGDCTIDTETLLSQFAADMPYCDIHVACIEQATVGQHNNVNWHSLRKQLVTASNFKRVVSRTETILVNPNKSCSALLNDLVSNAKDLENAPAVA